MQRVIVTTYNAQLLL